MSEYRSISKSVIAQEGADIATLNTIFHLAESSGFVKSVKVRCFTAPDGGDKQYTVDVQKRPAASAVWTTILSAVLTFVDADANNTTKEAAITAAAQQFAENDAFRVVVTASGTTGSQGQGLAVDIDIVEKVD